MIRLARSSRAVRLVSLLAMSSWLAIGDAGLAHSCPTHWSAPAEQAAGGHADHAAHSTGHETPAAPEHHGECSCVGTCSTASGVLVPRGADEIISARTIDAPIAPSPAIQIARRVGHHPLPYSNGPPPEARLVS